MDNNDESRNLLDQEELNKVGIYAIRGSIRCSMFIPIEDKGKSHAMTHIDPSKWSVSQLRVMADYMEKHQDMTIYDDGSGNPVKL